jgi:glycosyltransferase involved in cell wall biosynthesis
MSSNILSPVFSFRSNTTWEGIVITNISHEIIKETKCGMTVEYQKPEQIKNAITTMRDNPELRRRYGNNGRQAFLRKYNWKNMEEKL